MKDHVTILVVGDEGVGKSSLISAYISQHFPQEVPDVMTDAIIPPEITQNEVSVMIRDSSAKPGDRDVLQQKVMAADSIIALYDVTRPDTFESLQSFWLPLIKDLSAGQYKPVILVGTKTDLLVEEQDTQQLNGLLLAFPFVMNCWHCSAVNIQNLENVFFLAELFVNFPLSFILDVTEEEFTPAARRAFLRIFRIFDLDGDGLLNDAELADTQLRCFDDLINADELMALKRQIALKDAGGVQGDCVTFEGFVGLIKLNLIAHQYQVPWLILRRFDYDDSLNIMIPDEICVPPELATDQVTELSPPAREFLLHLAQIAYNESERPTQPEAEDSSTDEGGERECLLTWDALRLILSVLSTDTDDPWMDPPSFKTAWRHDPDGKVEQRILLTGLSHVGSTLSFEDWVTHWSLLALNEPAVAQELLFKLGYVEREDLGVLASAGPLLRVQQQVLAHQKYSFYDSLWLRPMVDLPPRRDVLQVCVLGDNGVGKSSFVWRLSGLRAPGIGGDVELGVDYSKYNDCIVVGGCSQRLADVLSSRGVASPISGSVKKWGEPSGKAKQQAEAVRAEQDEVLRLAVSDTYHLSIAAVPLDHVETWLAQCAAGCDLVLLMFQCADLESLRTAIALEERLPKDVPRREQVLAEHEAVLEAALLHTQEQQLPAPQLLSTLTGEGLPAAYEQMVEVATDPHRGLPRASRAPRKSGVSISTLRILSAVGIFSLSVVMLRYNKEVKDWIRQVCDSTREFFLPPALVH
eukprot:CAMPEP_0173324208 /NCGR_PEP_ID=MMETSP1143-20121109/30931_1 /TAXON_ID=483371 /ORGANISM="non described non described, Strain CCMP2298" /LENGTH=750 /DNA_ID=CAMNT_0014268231 /DNA_START=156 /DNA_END=2408 /DNA_ORIENTATION=+